MKHHLLRLSCLLLLAHAAFGQGSLNPPGAPAATMKSLDQLDAKLNQAIGEASEASGKAEKRIPIPFHPFTINQPGSYYLTTNLTANPLGGGITIAADNVTLDLNGFTLAGVGTGKGIDLPQARKNVTVRNGTIRGWGDGILAANLRNGRFEKLLVSDNTANGIGVTNGGAIVKDCTFLGNGQRGLFGRVLTVIGCTARENGTDGIYGVRSTISACAVSDNGGDGIEAESGSSVTDCVSRDNGGNGIHVYSGGNSVTGCSASLNTGSGILSGGPATISRCIASDNGAHGIVAGAGSLVFNNDCAANGTGAAPGAGIRVTGSGSRIESNNTANNDIGIQVAEAGNIIIKNSSRGGTDAFDIAAGNSMGQEIPVFNPSTTTVINTSNAWANFSY